MHLRAFAAKSVRCGLLAALTSLTNIVIHVQAFDFNQVVLETPRFLITNGIIEMDDGYLLKNGQYVLIVADIYGPQNVGMQQSEILPILDQPVMGEEDWNRGQRLGLLPSSLIRSRDSFYVPSLMTSFVIIGIKGKNDPNPLVTITSQPQSTNGLIGYRAVFSCAA